MAPDPKPNTKNSKKAYHSKSGRPRSTQSCNDVNTATKYRAQILREITNNLSRIHDLLLTEYQIRDINDTINKLLKERRAWEYRIKQLNGPDFTNLSTSFSSKLNSDSLTIKGYKYFGRAKELPDVVKLLDEVNKEKERTAKAKDSAKSLKQFLDSKNWPIKMYYFRKKEAEDILKAIASNNFHTALTSNDDKRAIKLDFTTKDLVTQDSEKMENFLLQQKKKFLLQRIRSKK